MGGAVLIFLFLPWIDRHPVKSLRYRGPLFKALLLFFAATFLVLGYLGTQPPTPARAELGLRLGELYFSFFLVLWWYSRERGSGSTWSLLAVLAVLFAVIDAIRWDSENGALIAISALLPLLYYALFLLGPLVSPGLAAGGDVPERVN